MSRRTRPLSTSQCAPTSNTRTYTYAYAYTSHMLTRELIRILNCIPVRVLTMRSSSHTVLISHLISSHLISGAQPRPRRIHGAERRGQGEGRADQVSLNVLNAARRPARLRHLPHVRTLQGQRPVVRHPAAPSRPLQQPPLSVGQESLARLHSLTTRAPPYRYDIQDLHVNGVHPQLISVSESYIQVYDSSTS